MSTGQRAGYFYPRSPCGERPFCASFQLSSIPISIHALLAESDAHKRLCAQRRYNFYPRSPCGERQWHLTKHPQHKLNFYPRSPCGERPNPKMKLSLTIMISIHALLAESDLLAVFSPILRMLFLSTLSLRRATSMRTSLFCGCSDFYPRSPCGERLFDYIRAGTGILFLSTLSLRRATSLLCYMIQRL